MFSNNKYKLKLLSGELETHEVFLDNLAHKKEEELGISEKKFEVKIKERVIHAIFWIFLAGIVVISLRVFYWQIIKGSHFYALAQNNKTRIALIKPERGIIYDANGNKLVFNAPAYDLVCDKRNFLQSQSKPLENLRNLSVVLRQDFEELLLKIGDSQESSVLLAENIDQETILALEARIGEFPDCRIEKGIARHYPFGQVFSAMLGYLGRINKEELAQEKDYAASDYIGRDGLEKYYETFLRGVPGKNEIIRDALGLNRGEQVLFEPEDGHNLVLHTDVAFQKIVYEALEKSIKNVGAKRGAAVALNPKNGAVLALVSYPAYNNNIFSQRISAQEFAAIQKDPSNPFFNRAISARYPVGSTIKPFLAVGALEEAIISPEKKINDQGHLEIRSRYDPSVVYRFAGVKPHGFVDMRKAIAVSSNIYFYTVGGGYENQRGLGPTKIKDYLNIFGWGEKTGIDLPGEFSGFVPDPEWKKRVKNEQWWDGDTYNLSIGQSDLQVTPLHVAVAYSAIANRGALYKPQIAHKVVRGFGEKSELIHEFEPEVISRLNVSPENLEIVREGMRDCVKESYGSCVMLNSLPIPVAGKTGTAETNKAGVFNAWFSGFAPYEDPEIMFVVTVEGVDGSLAAALPVAREVFQYYFTRK